MNNEVSMSDLQPTVSFDDSYLGDEYYESSLYTNNQHMDGYSTSPKKCKRLPSPASSSTVKSSATPSIMTTAGAGLSSLFSSISSSLQAPATTSSTHMSAAQVITTSSIFSSAYTAPATTSIFGSTNYSLNNLMYGTTPSYGSNYDSIFKDNSSPTTNFLTNYTPKSSTSLTNDFSTSYTSSYSTSYATKLTSSCTTSLTTSFTTSYTSSYTPSFTPLTSTNVSTSYAPLHYSPISSYAPLTSYSTVSSYSSVLDKPYLITSQLPTLNSYQLESPPLNSPVTAISYGDITTSSYLKASTSYGDNITSSHLNSSTSYVDTFTSNFLNGSTAYGDTVSMSPLNDSTAYVDTLASSYLNSPTTYGDTVTSSYLPYDSTTYDDMITSSYLNAGKIETTSSSYSSSLHPMTSLYASTTSSSYTGALSTTFNYSSSDSISYTLTSSHNPPLSLGMLGHSPIIEEDAENEVLLEDAYEEVVICDPIISSIDNCKDIVTTSGALYSTSLNSWDIPSSDYLSLNKPSYLLSDISEPLYEDLAAKELEEDSYIEEYREDFEEGVLPPVTTSDSNYLYTSSSVSTSVVLKATTAIPTFTTQSDEYFYQNSTYPLNSKLSTIPETVNDVYLSSNDLQEEPDIYDEQLTTPGAYDYTENETHYIASGDLKDTNLYQSNHSSLYTTSHQTRTTTSFLGTLTNSNATSNVTQSQLNHSSQLSQPSQVSQPSQPSQPSQQKKSRFGFGSFLSDGLNVIGSSVSTIKSTATNLAGGAVGVVGGVVGAATAAAQSAQSSAQNAQNTGTLSMQNNQMTNQQMSSIGAQNDSAMTSNQPPQKLTKQVTLYDEQNEEYLDPYNAKQASIL
jgi:trimeric autotransporter adhesin